MPDAVVASPEPGAGTVNTRFGATRRSEVWLPMLLLLLAGLGWWWSVRMAGGGGNRMGPSSGMSIRGAAAMSFAAFLAAWVAMMAAMMLPAVFPVVRLYGRAAARGAVAPVLVFVVGYLLVWTAVGVPVYLAWRGLSDPLARADPWIGRLAGTVAITTGVYQLTPLKTMCLRHCRSPMSFFLRHAKHLDRPIGAVQAGARHGIYCLGCCWMLMAILIAFGTMHLGLMVVLAMLILLEKDAPFGEQLAQLAAVAFLAIGAALLAHPALIQHIL